MSAIDTHEWGSKFTYTVGSVHTNTSARVFREAGYGDPHQAEITGSNSVDEGKDVNGG
jgi:hypothetical protein